MKIKCRLCLIILILLVIKGTSHARKPSFVKEQAAVISTSYDLLGMRDIEFAWGEETIWLSEIFRTWGTKGTGWLWNRLNDDEKLKLVESFKDDIEGKIYYFNEDINRDMNIILRISVNWVPLKEVDLASRLPVKASEILTGELLFKTLPDAVEGINITGIPLY
ncbi:MAG: hypothetical protein ABII23_00300, partial [bacterium]